MRLNVSFNISKRVVLGLIILLILVLTLALAYLKFNSSNPLPTDIQNHLRYQAIYPSDTHSIDNGSFKYHQDNKTLSFTVNKNGKKIVFTEQQSPETLGTGNQVYYPALGVHPYAQFNTKLGTVALTKFWQSGNLKPVGESAILASNGTLLIASSKSSLTNSEWKTLFESLKITK